MKTRLIAILTSALFMTPAVTMPPVLAADEPEAVPEADPVIGVLPDWVPDSFSEAMQFYNTHGKSYVADNVICLVRIVPKDKEKDYSFSYGGTMSYVNTPASGKPKTYELEIPEKPDPDDIDALSAYKAYCDSLGLPSYDYSFFESYAGSGLQYVFEVELFRVLEGYDLTVYWNEKKNGDYRVSETFSFENKDGTTVETDLYSWLPDSLPEYNSFLNKNGHASVQGNYLAFCAEITAGTGASLMMEKTGSGDFQEIMQSRCVPFELVSKDGSSTASVWVYEPVKDGALDVKWRIGMIWAPSQPLESYEGSYEIKDNCSVIIDDSAQKKGITVFTLVDKDTGETITIPEGDNNFYLQRTTKQTPATGDIYMFSSNPFTVDSLTAYNEYCNYSINLGTNSGLYDISAFEITSEKSDRIDITCKLEWRPSGDANSDGAFTIADMVVMQNWLLGKNSDAAFDWKAIDFCRDNVIDVFDFCKMRKVITKQLLTPYVEPEIKSKYGEEMRVLTDGLKMYLGPDESYGVIASLPETTSLIELGYQKDNNYWIFTEYEGEYGWIRIREKDGTYNVFYMAVADKPVIYLYPEQETDVHVELELTEADLSTTYPKYNNGWDVTAYPDGTLLNKSDGSHHKYLFWDAVNCRTRYDLSKGFCVAGSDTESFLKEKLAYMGLTEEEMNEFIVYWLPRMEHNAYNLISFQGDAYTDSAKLNITPSPDSICRIFMTYVSLDEAVDIEPQQLETFERNGFTVVEWGGSELSGK